MEGTVTISAGPQPEDSSIVLQTRDGHLIDNLQAWAFSNFEWAQLDAFPARYKPPLAFLLAGTVCPVYNCHGLTFGSRRTAVRSSNDTIDMILREDGYD